MLALHEVTKIIGRGARRRTVLNAISWEIPAGAKIAILGHPGSGKTTFLSLLSGARIPTSGWVERRAVVSQISALSRHASGPVSPRQLIQRLSPYFHYDSAQVSDFVESFADLQHMMDRPVRNLTGKTLQALNLALFYGIPCDYYLFDQRINLGPRDLQARTWEAFRHRHRHAGIILATSLVKEARTLDGAGAILHRGRITLFNTVDDAIEVFSQIEPDALPTTGGRQVDEVVDEPDFEF